MIDNDFTRSVNVSSTIAYMGNNNNYFNFYIKYLPSYRSGILFYMPHQTNGQILLNIYTRTIGDVTPHALALDYSIINKNGALDIDTITWAVSKDDTEFRITVKFSVGYFYSSGFILWPNSYQLKTSTTKEYDD